MIKDKDEGWRIWELDDKTRIPKEIDSGDIDHYDDLIEHLLEAKICEKTYAIRIGKKGLS